MPFKRERREAAGGISKAEARSIIAEKIFSGKQVIITQFDIGEKGKRIIAGIMQDEHGRHTFHAKLSRDGGKILDFSRSL